jgi:putative ABC transport system permease protein
MSESRWDRLRNVFRRSERAEVNDEISFHIEMSMRELIAQGMSPARAREIAEEKFGPLPSVESALIDSTRRRRQREDRAELFANLRHDLSFAVRSLAKNRTFASAAIATLALGVGATLAVFTVVNGVLLRPLPYKDPSRVAMIWTAMHDDGGTYDLPLSSGLFSDIERQSRQFAFMAAFRSWPYALATSGSDVPERVAGARVSPALFDVLGVRPLAGQAFTREQAVPGAQKVAMISYDLWQRRFGGDATVVGRQVNLSGASFTVVGVMPPGFSFPRGAELPAPFQFAPRTDVWTPLVFDSSDVVNYSVQNLSAIGKLAPSATRESAQAELSTILKNFLAQNAPTLNMTYHVVSLVEQAGGKVKRALFILLGAVACVLLIACANVASLLVARIATRQRELAVRAALGAGRSRIARQLVTENLVLAFVGSAIGGVLAYWATKFMLTLVPGSMPRADDIGIDWRVLAFAAAVAIVGGVVFGIAATSSVSWSRLAGTLHAGDTRSTGTIAHRYGRRLLVATEVALALMLLIGAALLTRTFVQLERVRPGFDPSNVLSAEVGLPLSGRFNPQGDGPGWVSKLNVMTSRLSATPGVVAAGAVSSLPLSGAFESGGIRIVGEPTPPNGQGPSAQYNVVAGDYFTAVRIPVLAGRVFDASDDAPGRQGVVINRELALKHFGSPQNAVGREIISMFDFSTGPRTPRTILGVVENVKQSALDDDPKPQAYVPLSQMPYPALAFVARTRGDPLTAVPALKEAVTSVDRSAIINDVRTMDDVVSQSLARQRFSMTLIGIFAGVALVLSIVGLYGVLALIVGQRRREIGVRMALGAQPGDVVRIVVGEGARVAAIGIVIGVAGAFALTRVLSAMLYGVSTTDTLTFAAAAAVVGLVALGATYVPARRAARVDPKTALVAD